MIRNRFKGAAKRVAIKLLGMEFDTEERDPAGRTVGDPNKFDPDKIPRVVDGSGDTPGPNHKTDIGRTWVSAQMTGGVAPIFVDVRPPAEVAAGVLTGALFMPGERIQSQLHRLPSPDQRVTVYDQTGEQAAESTAAWLRENGWPLARKLRGGFAEWMEFGEPVAPAPAHPTNALSIGDPVAVGDGRTGIALEFEPDGRVWVWVDPGEAVGPVELGANEG
jgi:rhodanese-related sulfurtransferase